MDNVQRRNGEKAKRSIKKFDIKKTAKTLNNIYNEALNK